MLPAMELVFRSFSCTEIPFFAVFNVYNYIFNVYNHITIHLHNRISRQKAEIERKISIHLFLLRWNPVKLYHIPNKSNCPSSARTLSAIYTTIHFENENLAKKFSILSPWRRGNIFRICAFYLSTFAKREIVSSVLE